MPPIFAPGDRVAGRYRIERFIARGGMGEVYEAEDLELGGPVALKTIRPQIAQDERVLERFRREIYLSRRVTHPNVCRIFDLFRHRRSGIEADPAEAEVTFLTMELLRGETLSDRLRRSGRIGTQEALPLVRQMAAALTAAHAAGVVHRDFKSRNVVLISQQSGERRAASGERTADTQLAAHSSQLADSEERVVVTDFGLASARDLDMNFSQSLTASGDMLGTPAYMAPEQVEGSEVGTAADLYSLGVVMFEMVTGVKPFLGESPLATAIKRLSEPPPSPRRYVPDLDPRWEAAILRCLERQAEDRFESAAEVVLALQGHVVSRSRKHQRRRQRRGLAVAALVLAVSAAGAGLLATRWPTAEGPGSPAAVHAVTRHTIAVIGFKNLSGDASADWLSTALAEMLSTELGASAGAGKAGALRVIPGENVARMKLELGLEEAESLAGDTLARIHKNLGADFVVLGSTIAIGSGASRKIRLDLRLQDTVAQETVGSMTETGTENQLFDLVSRVGRRLREKLGVGVPSAAEAAGALAGLPSGAEAARLYSEGLSRLRLFDSIGAKGLLEKAVAAEPQRALPHWALAAAWSSLGYDRQAREEAQRAFELSAALPREQKLIVEGRYHETMGDWVKAVEIYRVLSGFFPDSLEYGLLLVRAQSAAGKGKAALSSLEELRKLPPPAGEDPRIDLAEAEVADALSDYPRQQSAAGRAVGKGQAQGARLVVAQARIWEGLALWNLGEPAKAAAAYEDARRLYTEAGDVRGTARVLRFIAYGLANSGSLDEARSMYEAALASFREIGDRNGMHWTLSGIALLLYDQGDLSGARGLLQESLDVCREIGDQACSARTLQNLASVLTAEGRLAEARQRGEESLVVFRQIGDQRGEAWSKLRIAAVCWFAADLGGAETLLAEALQAFRQIGHKAGVAWALDLLGQVHTVRGDLAGARQELDEALGLREKINARGFAAETRLSLARLELEAGHAAKAEGLARKAAEELRAQGRRSHEAAALALLARSRLALQDRPGALDAAQRAADLARQGQAPATRFEALTAEAQVRATSGQAEDLDAAGTALDAIRAEARQTGFLREALEASLARAELELAAGRVEAGRALLEELRDQAAAQGFALIARKAAATP